MADKGRGKLMCHKYIFYYLRFSFHCQTIFYDQTIAACPAIFFAVPYSLFPAIDMDSSFPQRQ